MNLKDSEIEKKVILLKLLVDKEKDIEAALASLADTKMASLNELQRLYKELQEDGFITKNGELTIVGLAEAKRAKEEFSIEN